MHAVELPVEIIVLLFTFLSRLEDRKSASLVCKIWNEVYQCHKFRDKEKVTITKPEHISGLLQVPNKNYLFHNLKIKDTYLYKSLPFWTRYGHNLRALEIVNCNLSGSTLIHILYQCPNLSNLSVTGCTISYTSEPLLRDEDVNSNTLALQRRGCEGNDQKDQRLLPNSLGLQHLSLDNSEQINQNVSPNSFIDFQHLGFGSNGPQYLDLLYNLDNLLSNSFQPQLLNLNSNDQTNLDFWLNSLDLQCLSFDRNNPLNQDLLSNTLEQQNVSFDGSQNRNQNLLANSFEPQPLSPSNGEIQQDLATCSRHRVSNGEIQLASTPNLSGQQQSLFSNSPTNDDLLFNSSQQERIIIHRQMHHDSLPCFSQPFPHQLLTNNDQVNNFKPNSSQFLEHQHPASNVQINHLMPNSSQFLEHQRVPNGPTSHDVMPNSSQYHQHLAHSGQPTHDVMPQPSQVIQQIHCTRNSQQNHELLANFSQPYAQKTHSSNSQINHNFVPNFSQLFQQQNDSSSGQTNHNLLSIVPQFHPQQPHSSSGQVNHELPLNLSPLHQQKRDSSSGQINQNLLSIVPQFHPQQAHSSSGQMNQNLLSIVPQFHPQQAHSSSGQMNQNLLSIVPQFHPQQAHSSSGQMNHNLLSIVPQFHPQQADSSSGQMNHNLLSIVPQFHPQQADSSSGQMNHNLLSIVPQFHPQQAHYSSGQINQNLLSNLYQSHLQTLPCSDIPINSQPLDLRRINSSDPISHDFIPNSPRCPQPQASNSPLNEDLPQKLPDHLEYLDLSDSPNMTDSLFTILVKMSEFIKSLVLARCQITFDYDLIHQLYLKNGKPKEVLPCNDFFTFYIVFQYLGTAKQLTDLDLSGSKCDSHCLGLLSGIKSLKLRSLNLSNCSLITDEGVLKLTQSQNLLTELDLSYCTALTDDSVKCISTLTGMKKLNLQECGVSDTGIGELSHLQLEYLNVSDCNSITSRGLVKTLCEPPKTKMRKLEMKGLGVACDSDMINIFRNLPNLTFIDISCSKAGVTDFTIQSIISSCKGLEVLVASRSIDITDSGITGRLDSRQENKNANPSTSGASCSSTGHHVNLKSLTKLRCLQLGSCVRITDETLKYSIAFPNLTTLNLSYCPEITGEGLKYIAENNPAIEALNLDGCHNINDQGIYYLLKNLKKLKFFSVGSFKLTNRCLNYFQQFGYNLQYLDIRGCVNVSTKLSANLKYKFRNLQILPFNVQNGANPYE